MRITAGKGYSLLADFSARLCLRMVGIIAGEEACCDHAEIAAVDALRESMIIDVFDPHGARTWRRTIQLRDVAFYLEQASVNPPRPALVLRYPDATTLIFAERV